MLKKRKSYEDWLEKMQESYPTSTFILEEEIMKKIGEEVNFVYSRRFGSILVYDFHFSASNLALQVFFTNNYNLEYLILEINKNSLLGYSNYLFKGDNLEELSVLTKKCLDAFLSLPLYRLRYLTGELSVSYYEHSKSSKIFAKAMAGLFKSEG